VCEASLNGDPMSGRFLDIYIFRHGETDFNAENRFQGSIDIPLNPLGRQQASILAEVLKGKGIEIILSSPLSRAYETASIVAKSLQLDVVCYPELREIHCGDAEGRVRAEIIQRYGEDFWHRWRSVKAADLDLSFPGGESKRACGQRATDFFANLVVDGSYSTVAIASHGAFMRYAVHAIIDFGADAEPIPIPNCAVYQLRYHRGENRWELLDFNNHIAG
jgi:2,3-bisphosphoglycerate-dependent phosphoglycerate mutase